MTPSPRRLSRRSMLAALGGGVGAALVQAACGGSGDDRPTATPAPTPPTPATSSSATPGAAPTPATPTASPTPAVPIQQMIGHMILVGFEGLTADTATGINEAISGGRLGGLVVFSGGGAANETVSRNVQSPEQLSALTSGLQTLAPQRLIIAADQEGGAVARLNERFGFPPTVSHAYLGQLDDLAFTADNAGRMAATMAVAGVDLNLAPVLDVNVNPANPVIGAVSRSFSSDPDAVARHAKAFIEAHHRHGVLCALKHFPGHGSSTVDSHAGFTDVTATWSEGELTPFRSAIEAGLADAVMTAHIFNANLDPDYPATLSHATITGLLRGELGYDGVVITDSIRMGAIVQFYGFAEAIELAINAGADIIASAPTEVDGVPSGVAVYEAVLAAVQARRIPESRVAESYRRITALKSRIAV